MQIVQGNIENSLVPSSVEAEGVEQAAAKNNIFVGMGYSESCDRSYRTLFPTRCDTVAFQS
jgi:hypothetical protein